MLRWSLDLDTLKKLSVLGYWYDILSTDILATDIGATNILATDALHTDILAPDVLKLMSWLLIDKPEAKAQSKAQSPKKVKEEFGLWASH